MSSSAEVLKTIEEIGERLVASMSSCSIVGWGEDIKCEECFFIEFQPSYNRNVMFLPCGFKKRYGKHIPVELKFYSRNGDMFEGLYNSSNGSFIGLQTIVDRYCLTSSSFIFFTYMGGYNFSIDVMSSMCVEISYPSCWANFSINPQSSMHDEDYVRTTSGPRETVMDEVNNSLLRYNCSAYDGDEFAILVTADPKPRYGEYIEEQFQFQIDKWTDRSWIYCHLTKMKWRIEVRILNNRCFLHKGWYRFANALKLRRGDLCIFQSRKHNYNFNVAIFRNYSTMMDAESNVTVQKFVTAINRRSQRSLELSIPWIFWHQHEDKITEKIKLVVGDYILFNATYDNDRRVIQCDDCFFHDNDLVPGDKLQLHYMGQQIFRVTVCDRDGDSKVFAI